MDPGHPPHHPQHLPRPAQGPKWEQLAAFPDSFPADTGGACDLVKNPRMNKQFTPDLKG